MNMDIELSSRWGACICNTKAFVFGLHGPTCVLPRMHRANGSAGGSRRGCSFAECAALGAALASALAALARLLLPAGAALPPAVAGATQQLDPLPCLHAARSSGGLGRHPPVCTCAPRCCRNLTRSYTGHEALAAGAHSVRMPPPSALAAF